MPSQPSSSIQLISSYFRRRPLLAVSTIAFIPLISYITSSYQGYLALGPGGMPYNFLGWAIQACLQPLGRGDMISLAPFNDPSVFSIYAPHGQTSFLGSEPLPQRRGDRPVVPGYIAPQRQTTDTGDAALIACMNAHLDGVARENPKSITVGGSMLENRGSKALWSNGDLPSYLVKSTKGEFVHVHPEASSHIVLSLVDAKEATAKGWAQRHKLSGVLGRLPLTYVMVYAPRDDEEFKVWERLVGAAVAFNTAPLKA